MASSFDTSFQRDGGPSRRAGKQLRSALSSMTERQTQAYLMARETIRRVQRVSSLIAPAADRPRRFSGADPRASLSRGDLLSAS